MRPPCHPLRRSGNRLTVRHSVVTRGAHGRDTDRVHGSRSRGSPTEADGLLSITVQLSPRADTVIARPRRALHRTAVGPVSCAQLTIRRGIRMPATPSVVLHDVTFTWPDGTVALDHLSTASVPAAPVWSGGTGPASPRSSGWSPVSSPPRRAPSRTSGRSTCSRSASRGHRRHRAGHRRDLLGVGDQLRALRSILGGDADPAHFDALGDAWDVEERAALAVEGIGIGDDLDRPRRDAVRGQAVLVAVAGSACAACRSRSSTNRRTTSTVVPAGCCSTWSTPGAEPWSSSATTASCSSTWTRRARLRAGQMTVFGGTFSAFEEHLAVQPAAVEREVRVATQRHRTETRQRIEAERRSRVRAKAGEKAGRSMPAILRNDSARRRRRPPDGSARAPPTTRHRPWRTSARPSPAADGRVDPRRTARPRASRRHVGSPRSRCGAGRPSCRAGADRGRRGLQRRGQDHAARAPVGVARRGASIRCRDAATAHVDQIAYLPQHKDTLDDDLDRARERRRGAPQVATAELRNRLARSGAR